MSHFTVLKSEAVDFLNVKSGGVYFDMTFGGGGHSREILSRNQDITLICIDRDISVYKNFEQLKKDFPASKLHFLNSKFSEVVEKIRDIDSSIVADGFVFDFGVSSMQLDNAERGFSFQNDAPLSMEMGLCKISAFDIVNSMPEEKLANLIYEFADEKKSRQISHAICRARKIGKINTTLQLADIVKSTVGRYNDTIHPATRTFQAIRIAVNEELSEIRKALVDVQKISKNCTRLSCISFHSLEDSIIKDFVLKNSLDYLSKEIFDQNYGVMKPKMFDLSGFKFFTNQLHKKTIAPSDEEIKENYRSRSAKMRSFEFLLNSDFKDPL
jgi:16S rRNA (cytosine1402-N4)-methyltransferase